MKAIIITQPGGPEVLQVLDRPTPAPKTGEVLIRVAAAGINRPDYFQIKGNYPPPPGASPDIPGLEVAGTIVQSAPDSRWRRGDKVCALVSGGGYAEFCTAPEGQCLPIPENLSFTEAASLPETYFTVWNNVFDRGQLKAGESFLVHGGSSGIGVAAIQLAKNFGAQVFATAGSEQKCSICEDLGADKAINYKTQSFREIIIEYTHQKGIDLILDMIAGDYTADNLQLLKPEGRLVLINTMKGNLVNINLSLVMQKRLTITGSTLRSRDTEFKSAIAQNLENKVWPLLANGKIKPVVFETFPFEKAVDALRMMASNQHIGKIILTF